MGIIYSSTNKINGKMYIGQTIQPLSNRISSHKNSKHCIKLYRAIKKYGIENFEWKVELECNNKFLNFWEKVFITAYNCIESGYNLRSGGANGSLSDETKMRLSLASKGIPKSNEFRLKISGDKNHFYGKTHTQESKDKMSNSLIGRVPWNKDKIGIYSEDTIRKMSSSKGGKPIILTNNIEIKEFFSQHQAAFYLKCSRATIQNILYGKIKQYKGWYLIC